METKYLREYSFPGRIEPAPTRTPWWTLLRLSCRVRHVDSSDIGVRWIKLNGILCLVPKSLYRQALDNEVSIFSVSICGKPWRRSGDNVIRLGPHNILWIVE